MKKLILAAVLTLMTSFSVFAQADTASMIFDQLRTKLLAVDDYVADVKVKIDVPFMKVPLLSGKLYFKAPDKMKLERNGGIAILPKKNKSLSLNSMFPVGEVTVLDAGKDELNDKPVRVLKVIPQTDETDIILTKIWVDQENLLALRTETTTRDNGTIKMNLEFKNHIDKGLPDRVTVFMDIKEYKLPKGVTMDYEVAEQKKPTKGTKKKRKKGTIQINYINYEINKGLDDSIFDENE